MPASIQFTKTLPVKTDTIILPIIDGKVTKVKPHVPASVLNKIKNILSEKDGVFDSKNGSSALFDKGDQTYIIVGVEKGASQIDLEKIGGKLWAKLSALKIKQAAVTDILDSDDACALANGFYLRSYNFTKYKTKTKSKAKDIALKIVCAQKPAAERTYKSMETISDAVFFARDMVNEPPNTLYPESYVQQIKKLFKGLPVRITVMDEKKLDKMGAGALLAVGKGSERQPRLVTIEYDGRAKKAKSSKPLALVGKGVTFDTGGYSLKPRGSMETMKMDMGGSAAVIGAMKAIVENKVKDHVVACVALAENMIAGHAYRVDDVLTSLSGQTIEVINTDAEGRLCLADALTYVQDKHDPRSIVDVATLTGACMAALGLDIAGVFSNDKATETSFWKNGDESGDHFWPLPVNKAFDKQIDSPIADMRNLGSVPFAGASTAAVFLQRFITNDRPWAHLDIAGTAWRKDDADTCPKGATGFGVRALYHWVANQ
jgi:leucyl aminopeptidase